MTEPHFETEPNIMLSIRVNRGFFKLNILNLHFKVFFILAH
jgi:hypothetical protein